MSEKKVKFIFYNIPIIHYYTNHTTPEMLKRYIKADQLDVAQKLSDKYDYFD